MAIVPVGGVVDVQGILHKDFYLKHPSPSFQCGEYCWGNLEAAHPVLGARSEADVAKYRQDNGLGVETVRGRAPPKPFQSFKETSFPEFVEEVAHELFTTDAKPFPIQAQAWPCVLSGMDVVAVAPTGSGKTLAFLLPSLVHIICQDVLVKGDGPIALVLEPTRELALQTLAVATRFFERTAGKDDLRTGAVYGGVTANSQMPSEGAPDLGRWPELLVATPGRLWDLLHRGQLNAKRVSYFVLDEADLLIAGGHWRDQILAILSFVRQDKQLLLFSATWPQEAEQTARELCGKELVRIRVDPPVPEIPQQIQLFPGIEKPEAAMPGMRPALIAWLRNEFKPREAALVLCKSREIAVALSQDPEIAAAAGGEVALLSGVGDARERRGGVEASENREAGGDAMAEPHDRHCAYRRFLQGEARILISTFALGSRGLDYTDSAASAQQATPLSLAVVLFDVPPTIKDYAHCIGRTRRPGQRGGRAVVFLPETRFWIARELADLVRNCNQPVPEELSALIDRDRAFLVEVRHGMLQLKDGADPTLVGGVCDGSYDDAQGVWTLQATLPSYQRKLLHWLADDVELAHVSTGEHPNRTLHIARRREALPERFFLEGEWVRIESRNGGQRPLTAWVSDSKIHRRHRTIRVRLNDGRDIQVFADAARPLQMQIHSGGGR